MAEINTKTNKSVLEIRNEMTETGTSMEVVYVNGTKFCVLGYTSLADREASLHAIETAVNGSETLYEAMLKLTAVANLAEAAPDEEVEIDGYTYYLSYAHKALYNANGDEICNCNDLNCNLPREAIKALLTERAKH